MSKRWKITIGIIAGLAVMLLIIGLSPLGRFILTGGLANTAEQPFDARQWKEVKDEEPYKMRIRLMMLDDVMENRLKIGMDSTEVKEMLGEPERQYGFTYRVGMLAPGMDPMYLILKFDSKGKMNTLDVENEKELKDEKSEDRK